MPTSTNLKKDFDIRRVLAVMHFPHRDDHDHLYRSQYVMCRHIIAGEQLEAATGERVETSRQIYRELPKGPSYSEVLTEMEQRYRCGINAGGVLFCLEMLTHKLSSEPDSNVKKAKTLWADLMSDIVLYDGKKPTTGRASVTNHWSDFKSVSHFWAAYVQLACESYSGPSRLLSAEEVLQKTNLLFFLALAEAYRRFGEKFQVKLRGGSPHPVLDPEETWRIPDPERLPDLESLVSARTRRFIRERLTKLSAKRRTG